LERTRRKRRGITNAHRGAPLNIMLGVRRRRMNSIIAIHPYKFEGLWVFDDPKVGLVQEPFVSGADTIIDRAVAGIPNAESGFTLLFSAAPFPGFQIEFEWRRAELSGNWYYSAALDMEGWLCPALLKYFDSPPSKIYAQFRAKAAQQPVAADAPNAARR
jgi:hypothetical protein